MPLYRFIINRLLSLTVHFVAVSSFLRTIRRRWANVFEVKCPKQYPVESCHLAGSTASKDCTLYIVHTGDDTRRHGAIENGNTRSVESRRGEASEGEKGEKGEKGRGEARLGLASLGEVRRSGGRWDGVG